MKQEIIDKINQLASQDEPFLFIINYQGDKAFIRLLSGINPEECLFDFEGRGNLSHVWKKTLKEETSEKEIWKEEISETTWQIEPPLYEDYERSFNIVKNNIMAGNSYLTNLTCRVPVSCNLPLEEIFHRAKGKYKLLLRRKRTQAEDKAHLKEENIEEKSHPLRLLFSRNLRQNQGRKNLLLSHEGNPGCITPRCRKAADGRPEGGGRTRHHRRFDKERPEPGGRECKSG